MSSGLISATSPLCDATPLCIAKAGELLRDGQLVAFPTETVYGLGANALDDKAVAAIYATKRRPDFNPLIVHVSGMAEAENYVRFHDAARLLARAFWPGPLTLVLPRLPDCSLSLLVSAGMDTVAVRAPAHPVARALLASAAVPIAAPSANRSGNISPTSAEAVAEELGGDVAMILNGGPCSVGLESTIVGFDGELPVLLRAGAVTRAEVESLVGTLAAAYGGIQAPGMLASHYAPRAQLRLNATDIRSGEALLAFGTEIEGATQSCNLSASGDLREAAANLFAMLRHLDKTGVATIAVMKVPEYGLGEAINDRLRRAAAPRPSRA